MWIYETICVRNYWFLIRKQIIWGFDLRLRVGYVYYKLKLGRTVQIITYIEQQYLNINLIVSIPK